MPTCSVCGSKAGLGTATLGISESSRLRIRPLRTTNEAPSTQEKTELVEALRSTREYSAVLTRRIAQMQASLRDLFNKKEDADRLVAEISLVLHPIRAIPQHLLSELFTVVGRTVHAPNVDSLRRGDFIDSLHPEHPAWVVSKVSSTWRRAALATPLLWSQVTLSFDRYRSIRPRSVVFLLSDVLHRSGQNEITLHMTGTHDNQILNHPALPILLLSCRRWKSAAMVLPITVFQEMDSLPAPLAALRSLTLDLQDLRILKSPVRTFLNAPLLRSISTPSPSVLFWFAVEWNNLSEFHHLYSPERSDIDEENHRMGAQRLARGTLSPVQKLTITVSHFPYPLPNPTVLPHLKTLTVNGDSPSARELCKGLHLPLLQHLNLNTLGSLEHLIGVGQPVLFASYGRLSRLSICIRDGDDAEASALKRLLAEMPSVSSLELRWKELKGDGSRVCAALTATKGDCVLPMLEKLSMVGARGLTFDERIIAMIRSRQLGRPGCASLKRVEIRGDTRSTDEVKAAFSKLGGQLYGNL